MKPLSSIFLLLIGFNAAVWNEAAFGAAKHTEIYFLDVGQGDSQLIRMPGGADVLIDGGPDRGVVYELDKIMPKMDRKIDVVLITHPQLDHFGGLYDVLERYDVGAVITNGRDGKGAEWEAFAKLVSDRGIPVLNLARGDAIKYGDTEFRVLSPDNTLARGAELNDTSIVLLMEENGVRSLFTGDVGFAAEKFLVENDDMDVDILKVAHHGSKTSSGLDFLEEATPLISVIEVGKNRYGHPTDAALTRLSRSGSGIYRTDKNGTIRIVLSGGKAGIFAERK